MKIHSILLTLCSLYGLLTTSALADVSLPAIFSDHAVLKRTQKVPVWGKGTPGEVVTVRVADATASTKANGEGKWRVNLDLSKTGTGPFELVVCAANTLTVSDVLVGEVWLASGQSNMSFGLSASVDYAKEAVLPVNLMLREFKVQAAAKAMPEENCTGEWKVAGPQTVGMFSAVAYYFGKNVQAQLQCPVGIIHSSWGGTMAESWISREGIAQDAELKISAETKIGRMQEFKPKLESYIVQYREWLKRHGREDKPDETKVPAFAVENIDPKEWKAVSLPGNLSAQGLPAYGAFWLRTEVTATPGMAKKAMDLKFGAPDAFESLYWNGKLVRSYTLDQARGAAFYRKYTMPADLVKEGKNTLAIRLYAPSTVVKFETAPTMVGVPLSKFWEARSEYVLPDLPPGDPAPVAPAFIQDKDVATFLFNGMIYPLVPYALSGVIWYQGEANTGRAFQYRTTFPLLIKDWRQHWDQGDFPFYYCQLANFMDKMKDPVESNWAELRDTQNLTLKVPHTGQAVLIDSGESADIHPRNKLVAGDRLARIALAQVYGKATTWSGPVYESMASEGNKITLTFSSSSGKLVARELPGTYDVRSLTGTTALLLKNSPQSELEGFAICGEDRKWVWANARITGEHSVSVWAENVPVPVAVRYAWAFNPTCNLYNSDGLPASPFRTDDFPLVSRKGRY